LTDLTQGSIGRHIVGMAAFIGAGLVFQAAYFIVDLYFVSQLGKDAIAGVGSAGNFSFLGIAASQLVGVGSLSLISQAAGRKENAYANLVFNQVCGLAVLAAFLTLATGYVLAGAAMRSLSADRATAELGRLYLYGFLPSMACMFPMTAISSALRATGVVRPTMLLQTGAVILNAILAPILIVGWGTGYALGAFGAGLSSSIASCISIVVLVAMLPRIQTTLSTVWAEYWPRMDVWLSIIRVGLPAAGEFFLIFLISGVIYWSIRRYGPAAQAGYGIGTRIMQALFLPALAVSFASAAIAGQNFGAGLAGRVAATFRVSAIISVGFMLLLTFICQWRPAAIASAFTNDPGVLAIAAQFLRVISWNFVSIGFVYACSGMFQAFGDTRPSFTSSATRLVTFAIPAIWMSKLPGAALIDFWHLSVAAATLQAVFSLLLLRQAFRQKMPAGWAGGRMSVHRVA
jgi:putative MATE family efflux protein